MKTAEVRNLELGKGIPAIAVPVSGKSAEEISGKIRKARSSGADIVELRADVSAVMDRSEELLRILRAARNAAGNTALLFTYRTASEGGDGNEAGDGYRKIIKTAASSGCVDLVDIELMHPDIDRLIREVRETGSAVVCSSHDFLETPPDGEILRRLAAMEKSGADIAKCAFMPSQPRDTVRLLGLQARASKELGIPSVLISMGKDGVDSRVAGEVFGSAFTFGCLPGEESAPGQLPADELRRRMNCLHRRIAAGRHIFLIGFMGCGKSTAGRELSRRTGRPLIEMDERIEQDAGKKITDIFREDGEDGFRDLESALLSSLWQAEPSVVSCGGGAVLRSENRYLMKALGRTILLTASPEETLRRLSGESGGRPNIRNRMTVGGITELMNARRNAYLSAADYTVDTDGKTPDEICGECMKHF